MEGKVNVSILQWEKMRDELKELISTKKILERKLIDSEKQVQLTIITKHSRGYMKYNRWNERNEYVTEDYEVSDCKYINLSDVEAVLLAEAKDKVQEEINNHSTELIRINDSISKLKSSHQTEIINLNKSWEDKISKKDDEIKNLNQKISDIESDKKAKETERTITDYQIEIANLKETIEELKNKVTTEPVKRTFWSKWF